MSAAFSYLRKNLPLASFIVFLLIAIPFTAYLLSPKRNAQTTVLGTTEQKPENKISEKEAKDLLEKIGTLMDLPKDEMPTIGTVKNKFQLPPQPFYAKAENGDRVLIYLTSQKAILYRPSTHRIVEVGSVSVPTLTPTTTVSSNETVPQNPEETNSKRRRILKSPSEKNTVKE